MSTLQQVTRSGSSLARPFQLFLFDTRNVDITPEPVLQAFQCHDLFDLNPDWGTSGEDIFEEPR
jgi:hypothetical protein